MLKKMYKMIKNNIVSFVVGLALFLAIGGVVAATTYNSADVGYNLTNISKVTSNIVKGALDQLFERAASYKKYYYAFGDPTTSSPIDYTTLGHRVFVRVSEDNIGTANKEVCIIRNGELGCFKLNNFNREKYYIQAYFSTADDECDAHGSYVYCSDDVFRCDVSDYGLVICYDYGADVSCGVYGGGNVTCS